MVNPSQWDFGTQALCSIALAPADLHLDDPGMARTSMANPTDIGPAQMTPSCSSRLSDGAGEVAAIGDGVTPVRIGDRIAGCFHPRWYGGPIKPDYLTDRLGANLDGMLAEYAVLSEEAPVILA
jgi:NADPH:quinone reductase-like Zn-dependent oxidoreductase